MATHWYAIGRKASGSHWGIYYLTIYYLLFKIQYAYKANLNSNASYLIDHPKLINAFILIKSKGEKCDLTITSDKKDYTDNKVYYICRWLNHSFMPFTKRQEVLYQKVLAAYNKLHSTTHK